jgi:hypothetical protein
VKPFRAPFLRQMQRNHAIEHATVHILSELAPGLALAGRSDSRGFFLYGDVTTQEVRSAVEQALGRLTLEPGLAVHPHCGTNLVVAGVVSAAASLAALWTTSSDERARRPWAVLPRLLLAGTLAAAASQPLGPIVQRCLSTSPDVAGSRVLRITERRRGRHRLHRVDVTHARSGPTPGQAPPASAPA